MLSVIHKFILVLMKYEDGYFKLIMACIELIITIMWRVLRQTRLRNWSCMIVLGSYAMAFSTMILLSTYDVLPAKFNLKPEKKDESVSLVLYAYMVLVGLNFFDFKYNLVFLGPCYVVTTLLM